MKLLQLATVVVLAAVAFFVTAALLAANARPEPPPCNDTFTIIVDTPASGSQVDRVATASCAAPEAPAWLVLGGGGLAAGGVVVGYALLVQRRSRAGKELAQQPS